MLPRFDENVNLPPGIHRATYEEIAERFGIGSEEREGEIKELSRFIESARSVGAKRLIINGSFVTDKVVPNDLDLVVLPGACYPTDPPFLRKKKRVGHSYTSTWQLTSKTCTNGFTGTSASIETIASRALWR